MYLLDRSVLSFLQDKCTVQSQDHKESLCSHRSDDSFLHSSHLGRLAPQNTSHNAKQRRWCYTMVTVWHQKSALHNIVRKWVKLKLQKWYFKYSIIFCLFIQSLPIAFAVVTEINCPCHNLKLRTIQKMRMTFFRFGFDKPGKPNLGLFISADLL